MNHPTTDICQDAADHLVSRWKMVGDELQFVGMAPRPREIAVDAEMEQDELDPDDELPSCRA